MKNVTKTTLLSTLGIPVLQTIISKNPLKALSKDKYKFKCLSQIKGRRRYKSDLLKQEKFATALKDKIDSFKLLKKLTINPVTGSMLLEYTCAEEKIDEMIAALNEQSKKLSDSPKQPHKTEQKKFQRVAKGAIGASAAFAAGRGAAAIGKGMGRGMKGGGATSIFPTLLSSLNLTGLSGIVATACLAWGGYKLFTRNQIPVGPQLVWFGYKAIEGLSKR